MFLWTPNIVEREPRKLVRKAHELLGTAKNNVDDDVVPDNEILKMEWENTISFFKWGGNVVIGPNDDLYFEGAHKVFMFNVNCVSSIFA